jgi:hypothetical protein
MPQPDEHEAAKAGEDHGTEHDRPLLDGHECRTEQGKVRRGGRPDRVVLTHRQHDQESDRTSDVEHVLERP